MSEGFAGRKNDSCAGQRFGWVCGAGRFFGPAPFCFLFCELKTAQGDRGGQVAVKKGALRLGCLRVSPAEKMTAVRRQRFWLGVWGGQVFRACTFLLPVLRAEN